MNAESDSVSKAFITLNAIRHSGVGSSGTMERMLANPVKTGSAGLGLLGSAMVGKKIFE